MGCVFIDAGPDDAALGERAGKSGSQRGQRARSARWSRFYEAAGGASRRV
jgi:hypothetical protein